MPPKEEKYSILPVSVLTLASLPKQLALFLISEARSIGQKGKQGNIKPARCAENSKATALQRKLHFVNGKLKSTYVDALPQRSIPKQGVYSTYGQAVAIEQLEAIIQPAKHSQGQTGGKEIRKAFRAMKAYIAFCWLFADRVTDCSGHQRGRKYGEGF